MKRRKPETNHLYSKKDEGKWLSKVVCTHSARTWQPTLTCQNRTLCRLSSLFFCARYQNAVCVCEFYITICGRNITIRDHQNILNWDAWNFWWIIIFLSRIKENFESTILCIFVRINFRCCFVTIKIFFLTRKISTEIMQLYGWFGFNQLKTMDTYIHYIHGQLLLFFFLLFQSCHKWKRQLKVLKTLFIRVVARQYNATHAHIHLQI